MLEYSVLSQQAQQLPAGVSVSAAHGRMELIDVLRGIAILYIALDHAVVHVCRLLTLDPYALSWLSAYKAFDLATTGTRITALMFACGIFLDRACAKGAGRFLKTRATALVWPLALWSSVQVLTLSALLPDRALLASGNLDGIVRCWLELSGQFWFLYVLILCQLLHLALRRLDRTLVLGIAAAMLAASVLLDGLGVRGLMIAPLRELGHLFIFCWLGHLCAASLIERRPLIGRRWLPWCSALFAALVLPAVAMEATWQRGFLFLSGLPALPLMLAFAEAIAATRIAPALCRVGRDALALLCLQTTIAAVIAAVLIRAGLTDILALIAAGVGGSVWLSLLVLDRARSCGIAVPLGLPRKR